MQIVEMTPAYAAEIARWHYPAPYDCYDMTQTDPAALADPGRPSPPGWSSGGSGSARRRSA